MFFRDDDDDEEFKERLIAALENEGLSSEIPSAISKLDKESNQE